MSIPEERFVVPDPPRLGGALRAAGVDLVTNLWPFLPANVLVGLAIVAVTLVVAFVHPLGVALLPLVGVPLGGLFRVAARVQREHGATLPDSFRSWIAYFVPSFGLAAAILLVAVALVANVVLATGAGDVAAAVFATIAFWAFVAFAAYSIVAWPLVVDPVRADEPLRERLALAGYVLATRPARLVVLTAILFVLVALMATLVVAPLLIGLAYVAATACRYVLPLADRLEERPTKPTLL